MSEPATIMIASSVHPWDDARIFYRQALSLAKHYKVELHAVAPFREKYHRGIKVVGLPSRSRWLRPLQWITLFGRALKSDAAVIHIHDPELLLVGIPLQLCGRRVVYDIHEHVTADIAKKNWLPRPLRWIAKLGYRLLSTAASQILSAFVAASGPIGRAHRHSQLVVVENYPPLEVFEGAQDRRTPYNTGDTLKLFYSGSMQPSRGIVEILEACGQLPEHLAYRLDVFGVPPVPGEYARRVKSALEPVASLVTFHGWRPFPELAEEMSRAHLGLVCTQPNEADPQGSPLKLLEYLASGLGIVVTDFPEWRPLLDGYPAHIFVNPTKPDAIAEGIVSLADFLASHRPQQSNGAGIPGNSDLQSSVRFKWADQERILLDLYRHLLPVRVVA